MLIGANQAYKVIKDIGDSCAVSAQYTTSEDLSGSVIKAYGVRHVEENNSSNAFVASCTFSNMVFYEYQSQYEQMDVDKNTIVSIPENHTLTAIWEPTSNNP